MEEAPVEIVPFDPNWSVKFEEERKLIESTIGEYITGGVHHIGSTSIPNLSAKPVIDILIGVNSLEDGKPCIPLLERIQYNYFPYHPEYEHWFCKPSTRYRTHDLHIMAKDSDEFKKYLAFRDYLRGHTDEVKEYEKLKIELAQEFKDDPEAYMQKKIDFFKKILEKAVL